MSILARKERAVMDKFEALASASQFSVGILGNPETSDFALVDLGPKPLPENLRRDFTKRGLYFLGVAGIVQGTPQTALAEPLDDADTSALAQAFLQHLEHTLNAGLAPKGRFRVPEPLSN
jgi:hypothetical protein